MLKQVISLAVFVTVALSTFWFIGLRFQHRGEEDIPPLPSPPIHPTSALSLPRACASPAPCRCLISGKIAGNLLANEFMKAILSLELQKQNNRTKKHIVEAGSRDGQLALYGAKLGFETHIFDASPVDVSRISANLEHPDNTEVVRRVKFHKSTAIDGHLPRTISIYKGEGVPRKWPRLSEQRTSNEKIDVQGVPLDYSLKDIKTIYLLRVFTLGRLDQVLDGTSKLLQTGKIEFLLVAFGQGDNPRALHRLCMLGYKLFYLQLSGLILKGVEEGFPTAWLELNGMTPEELSHMLVKRQYPKQVGSKGIPVVDEVLGLWTDIVAVAPFSSVTLKTLKHLVPFCSGDFIVCTNLGG